MDDAPKAEAENPETPSAQFFAAVERGDTATALELIRGAYDAVAQGDWDVATALFAPDIEWVPPREAPLGGRTHRGAAEAEKEAMDAIEPFENWRWEPSQLIITGGKYVVIGRTSGRGKGSGIEVSREEAHVFTERAGKIARVEMFFDREEALRAAGAETGR